jgi:hypothetical protein
MVSVPSSCITELLTLVGAWHVCWRNNVVVDSFPLVFHFHFVELAISSPAALSYRAKHHDTNHDRMPRRRTQTHPFYQQEPILYHSNGGIRSDVKISTSWLARNVSRNQHHRVAKKLNVTVVYYIYNPLTN